MPIGAVLAFQIIVVWTANSFIRPMVKRSSAIAICNMIGNYASAWGSYLYPASSAPHYILSGSISASMCLVVTLLALVLRYAHQYENKKLDEAERDAQISMTAQKKKNTGFRYVY